METMEDLPLPIEITKLSARAASIALGTRITFLGHASMVIEMDGVRIVTDPVLRRLVGPLYRRVPRPLTEPLIDPDVLLISHLHLDHYDPRSLRLFRRDTPVLAPMGAARADSFAISMGSGRSSMVTILGRRPGRG